MKHLTIAIFFSCLISHAHSQTFGAFPLFDLARNFYNPAFTGAEGKARIYVMGSYQYRMYLYQETPNALYSETNSIIDFSSPVYRHGNQQFSLGVNYARQRYDVLEVNDIRVNMSYMHALGKHKLSYGANIDWIHDYADYRGIGDITTAFTDKTLNAGYGAAFHHTSGFYMGASANKIIHNRLRYGPAGSIYKIYQSNYFISSGIKIKLSNRWMFKPSVLIHKYYNWNASGNLTFEFRKHFQFGISYNAMTDQPGVRFGYQNERIGIHYTYGNVLALNSVYPGLHTCLLSYTLAK